MTSTILIQSVDGQTFTVDRMTAINRIPIIGDMMDNMNLDDQYVVFPRTKVHSNILRIILEWATHHKDDPIEASRTDPVLAPKNYCIWEEPINIWDNHFCTAHQTVMLELLKAANHLQMLDLLDMLCKFTANGITGKTEAELRAMFGIEKVEDKYSLSPHGTLYYPNGCLQFHHKHMT